MGGDQERLGFRSVDPVGVGRFRYDKYLLFYFDSEIQDGGAAVKQAVTAATVVGRGEGK